MDTLIKHSDEPKQKKPIATLIGLAALIAAQFLTDDGWLQNVLLTIGVAGFALEGLFVVQYDRAHKKWLASQPDDVDPLRGAPDLPHVKQSIALAIGMGAFFSIAYVCVPLRETGFTNENWWVLLLIPVMLAGFGFASWIQKKYNKAYMTWRDSQDHGK